MAETLTTPRPVRTFDTAAVYFHRFRLRHREAEYNLHDSAMAALFVACKVEDTIKKSKDILCAAHNLKNPDHPTTTDDKVCIPLLSFPVTIPILHPNSPTAL